MRENQETTGAAVVALASTLFQSDRCHDYGAFDISPTTILLKMSLPGTSYGMTFSTPSWHRHRPSALPNCDPQALTRASASLRPGEDACPLCGNKETNERTHELTNKQPHTLKKASKQSSKRKKNTQKKRNRRKRNKANNTNQHEHPKTTLTRNEQ